MKTRKSHRLWELDALRGVALVLMVIYHTVYSMGEFFGVDINFRSSFWYYEGRLSAALFIILAGVASSLIAKKYSGWAFWRKQSIRAIRLIGLGLVITAVTWIFYREKTIWFGILHFLGVSILLSSFFARRIWPNVILAAFSFSLGDFLKMLSADSYHWLIFGLRPPWFQSLDYYPIFPRIGWMLLGIALGNWIYSKRDRLIHRSPSSGMAALSWIGQKSLWIYMLHQPILLGVLWLILSLS